VELTCVTDMWVSVAYKRFNKITIALRELFLSLVEARWDILVDTHVGTCLHASAASTYTDEMDPDDEMILGQILYFISISIHHDGSRGGVIT
jgi:hypothetical protein